MTFDLDVAVHRDLRRWAVEHDVKLTDVWRMIEDDLEGRQIGRRQPK